MASTDFPKLLKSRSNDRCRESSKHHFSNMGPVYNSQFKTFKEEDDEFSATLKKAELLDQNNCTWLSSGNASSPSSCFQDNNLSLYTDLKIDAWLLSLLSTPSTKSGQIPSTEVKFFDGSRVNPIEEASLVLDQRKLLKEEDIIFHENLEDKEVVSSLSWLATSIEDESSSISSISDSSDTDYISFSSCSSSDYSVDLEECGINKNKPLFWPSDWTSDWDSDTKEDFFIMSPRKSINDFDKISNKPPRFKKPKKTSTKIVPFDTEADFEGLTEAKSEPIKTMTKTPVFWPSGCVSEWGSDAKLDLFVMSPRKDIYSFGESPKTSPDALRLRVVNGNMELEKGCSRRLEFNSCMKTEEVKPLTKKSVRKHRIVLEDLLLVDKLNVEGAIEEVLGLDEFDGHHGLGSEFDKEEFSLVEIF